MRKYSANRFYDSHHVEDGQFKILGKLTKKQKLSMEKRYNLLIEEVKYIDFNFNKAEKSKEEKVLRIFSASREINQLAIVEGKPVTSKDEIVMDPKFAKENNYQIGDSISIRDSHFKIVGYGITPDYVYVLKNTSDFLTSPQTFGVAYLNEEGFERIKTNESKSTLYSYKKMGNSIEPLKKYLRDHTILLDFLEKKENSRIETIFDDSEGPKQMALVIGLLLVVIVAFIISISIQNTIQEESQTIGILYAQGINKREMIKHYMILPVLLVLIGTFIGYGGGVLLSEPIIILQRTEYTVPDVIVKDSFYLIFIGIILPITLAVAITYFYLSKTLDKTPLSLLRGEYSNKKVSKLERICTFNSLHFFPRFRLKGMIRERRSMLALLIGVLLAVTVLMASAYIRDSCIVFVEELIDKVPFNYIYTFNDPGDLHKYSKQGELTTIKPIKVIINQEKKNFTIQGIKPDSKFFKSEFLKDLKENEVLISSSILTKFNLELGDRLLLFDDIENKYYEVVIKDTSEYDYGQYLYTNIYIFNKIFNIRKDSYNALMTYEPLDIAEEKINSVTVKNDMIKGIGNLLGMINVMSGIMLVAAVCILITIIYLLMNMVINKSKTNISMVKIFGYSQNEISQMYMRGTYLFLLLAFFGGRPLGYIITKNLYDGILADMQQYVMVRIKNLSLFQ